jgi:hypothetical protein
VLPQLLENRPAKEGLRLWVLKHLKNWTDHEELLWEAWMMRIDGLLEDEELLPESSGEKPISKTSC